MQPSPEITQSCLAMTVAEASRAGSIVIAVVTSLVALSSSSACSRMASIFRLLHSILAPVLNQLLESFDRVQCLLAQRGRLRRLLPQSRNHLLRRLGQKTLILELPFSVDQYLLILLQFLAQPLTFGGNIDLPLIREA